MASSQMSKELQVRAFRDGFDLPSFRQKPHVPPLRQDGKSNDDERRTDQAASLRRKE